MYILLRVCDTYSVEKYDDNDHCSDNIFKEKLYDQNSFCFLLFFFFLQPYVVKKRRERSLIFQAAPRRVDENS